MKPPPPVPSKTPGLKLKNKIWRAINRLFSPSNRDWEDVLVDPYLLLNMAFGTWYQLVDEKAWEVLDLARASEKTVFEEAAALEGRAFASLTINYHHIHAVAKEALHMIEGVDAVLRSLASATQAHAEMDARDTTVWKAAHDALQHRAEMFFSTRLRLASIDQRLKNCINLAFNIRTMRDSMVMREDSYVMKSLAVLGMVFLPISTVSSIFGTQFFGTASGADASSEGSSSSSKPSTFVTEQFWIFWSIVLPIMIGLLLGWALWIKRSITMASFSLKSLSLALCTLLPAATVAQCKPLPRPTVAIDSGAVAGTATAVVLSPPSSSSTSTSTSSAAATVVVDKFLGIPYGAPPVRFAPPQPAPAWHGTYDASRFTATCVQKFDGPPAARNLTIGLFNTPPPPGDEAEDCLSVNVWTPRGASAGSKAVLLWFFGGGFSFGSGALPLHDGTLLAAEQDVVVVTFNYRTNVFGFPGDASIPLGERNLGFLDQRLALDAGGGSVDALLGAPPKGGLPFAGAIMQSGQSSILVPNNDTAVSWAKLAAKLGCPPRGAVECLRKVPARKIKDTAERERLTFSPQPDGVTWAPKERLDRINSAQPGNSSFARVPILIGSTTDEGRTFMVGQNDTAKVLGFVPKKMAEQILAAYPIGSPGIRTPNDQVTAIYGDMSFHCPAKVVAEDSAAAGIPTWRYVYNASFPNARFFPGSAYHSTEIAMVFGTYPREGATGPQEALSRAMRTAWADFAKDPSKGPGGGKQPQAPDVVVFGNGDAAEVKTVKPEVVDKRCALFKPIIDQLTGVKPGPSRH
ncbi:para-nitrobenzyl esterase [Purpureocillium lavendulum]|uniref:Para-nitrobenzyl esterase n=1 Tax=Purpureocillium lavendulum TaxID=1247861 RepID=A0AB34G0L9_9HYPO|nr:para-nitrobenzyl esterase [Purpureocillium lavendulum]